MSVASGHSFVQLSNESATSGPYTLVKGWYALTVTATWGGGTVELDVLAGDGTTKIPVRTAFTVDAFDTGHLPDGAYYFTITTATGVYLTLSRVADGK